MGKSRLLLHASLYLHGLASEYKKILCAHHHETHELFAKDLLNLVGLLDGDTDPQGVDRAFHQYTLTLRAADNNGRKQQLLILADFDLRLVVSLDDLAEEM